MNKIKIQCPAKVNLGLKVINKRSDGFHNIESIMQTISLYDFLTISFQENDGLEIILNGTSSQIPYDERNLVYKAAKLFLDRTKISNKKIEIYIEKNIPVSAGLAGGSTDAAGTVYGLNKIFDEPLSVQEVNDLCSLLGSDLNVCLNGGRILAKSRGEAVEPQEFKQFNLSLIKPKNLGISAKEAYTKFSFKMENRIDLDTRNNYNNDLEWAIINDYKELQYIKNKYPNSEMTGSGSSYYIINGIFDQEQNYEVFNNLTSISFGVKEVF